MKKKKTPLKSWADITLGQYEQIVALPKPTPDDYIDYLAQLVSIVYGVDIQTIPVSKIPNYIATVDFVKQPVQKGKIRKEYILNNRTYTTTLDLTQLSVAQYVDFTNYSQDKEHYSMSKLLSCFLIPKGHTYNDGYDINEVIEDCKQMKIPDVTTITFFFEMQYKTYISLFLSSLKEELMKETLTEEERKEITEKIDILSSVNSDFFHS